MKTIKSKITSGVLFLFAVILILSIVGIYFINQLAQSSKGTITENYRSVDYMMNMLRSLDEFHSYNLTAIKNKDSFDSIHYSEYAEAKKIFEKNLELESENITESGERELVNELQANYSDYFRTFGSIERNLRDSSANTGALKSAYLEICNNINEIYRINMAAIHYKNNELQVTANDVVSYMSVVATLAILITLSFIFSFPSRIVEPVKELTERIKSVSNRNYDQRVEINSNDEFGELAGAFNIMAERLKVYEEKHFDEIIFEKKRMEALVQNFEDGVLLIDENNKVVVANDTMLQITGLKEDEIILHSIDEAYKNNDLLREVIKTASELKSNNGNENKPLRVVLDGHEYFYRISSENIITYSESSKQQTFIGNLILLRNITRYQELDLAKTNLLATVSHELKTPLSSINISLKLLGDSRIGGMNDEQKEIITSLRQQSNRLSRVINELLDYSQVETGNIKLRVATVKPDDIIDLSATALIMQLSEKNIHLDTNIEEGMPPIKADLEKTVWVLVNLLNNAIRYSKPEDSIILRVRKENDEIIFSVKDHGPGIIKEDQEKLFQRFVQVGNKSKTGWGLGLAIAKEFVQAQGGRIWVESIQGEGSEFSFSLPYASKS